MPGSDAVVIASPSFVVRVQRSLSYLQPSPPSPTMTSSTATKDIANAWINFYSRHQRLLGGGRGTRTRIGAARKEWSTILNNLRGGMFRPWPTEPDEIRQIQELLHWEQCDMWSAIDGTTRISAHHHNRTTTSVRRLIRIRGNIC